MKGKQFFIIAIILLFAAGYLEAWDPFTARVYLQGSEKKVFLFTQTSRIERNGDKVRMVHSYIDTEGTLFASEIVNYENGHFHSHEAYFHLFDEESLILKKGNEATITYWKKGKTRSRSFPYTDEMVFGPTRQRYFTDNLEQLKNGEKVALFLPVPYLVTTVEFQLYMVEHSPLRKPGTLILEMNTRSLLVRLFTDPVQYVVESSTGTILEIHGPTLLKRRVNNKWEFVDAEIYLSYPQLEQ